MLEEPGDVDRAMSRIGSESERLNALANDMLQLARDGTDQDEVADVDIAVLVDEVVADLRAAYPRQCIESDIDRSRPLTARGSRDRLLQAILNLGSNACHHSPSDDTILISAHVRAETIRIGVADNGPGVDSADRDRIFLPFFRSDAARNRDGQHGAGLGLSLARRVAERHHGTLSLESPPAGGATFVLTIPRQPTTTGGDEGPYR
jgi:two-component system OmpR family sensor kinase